MNTLCMCVCVSPHFCFWAGFYLKSQKSEVVAGLPMIFTLKGRFLDAARMIVSSEKQEKAHNIIDINTT
jgi:hypothetical protein